MVALLQPATSELRWLLADLERRYGNPLVLLPMSRWVSPDLAQTYSGRAKLELAFLEHRLQFDEGHLTWFEPEAVEPAPGVDDGAAFATAFDGGRPRLLTLEEYQRELKEKIGEVDVLIDIAVSKRRNCRTGRKDANGEYNEEWMPTAQAKMLARLVLGQRAMRPAQLRKGVGNHDKLFDRARGRFEQPPSKSAWRYFLNVPGETAAEKQYVFQPPEGTKYLVLYTPDFEK